MPDTKGMEPMSLDDERLDDETLRSAWRERAAERTESCPPSDELWRAVGGELSAERREELIQHAAQCAACAEAWRLARSLGDEPGRSRRRPPSYYRRIGWLAAAALLVVAFGTWFVFQQSVPQAPTVRDSDPIAIVSLLEEDQTLPRDDFRLRWTGAPPRSVYRVEVGTPELRVLTRVVALTDPEFVVPADRLASIESGGKVAWRVETTLPDGRLLSSDTFVNRVGDEE